MRSPDDPEPDAPRAPRERWRDADAGEHYAHRRWASTRRSERDPRLLERLLARLGDAAPGPGAAVLDVPAGTGRLHATLAARGWRVVSADVSAPMLAAFGTPGAPRVRADVRALPFPTDAFELVVCCRLLHHLRSEDELHATVAELVRVSRRYVAASFWDRAAWPELVRRVRTRVGHARPRGRVARPRAALHAAFEAAGARPLDHAASLRYVARQTFLLAEVPVRS